VAAPGDSGVRVSDADRDQVLAKLRDGFADGRLTHETFAGRAEAALRARFGGDLRGLVADLPRPRQLGAEAAAACRRAVRSTGRSVRGWPQALRLPPGPQRGSHPVLRLPAGPQAQFTIGREQLCDLTLADETVSRWHASLQWDGDGWLLDDLGSTNGTRLNGWRVTTPSRVDVGDLVSFGAATFVLADRPG
jgi:pSer/pThr/pTyr-binding forkhead associated (FHA) protein